MVLGLLDQQQIFSQLYLIEFLGFLTRFGMLFFFTGLLEFLVKYLAFFLFSIIVVLDGKGSLEYLVKVGVPEGSILGLTLFLLYIIDLRDDVICDIAIYADDTTFYSKCHQASDLCQQLELTSELESNLQDTGLG